VGEALRNRKSVEFLSLRIARVVGAGIARTSSPWRSQIFEPASITSSIRIPFDPEAILSLVHVEDVAQMLAVLAEAPVVRSSVYNTPVETWKAQYLKEIVEAVKGVRVELSDNGELGGPICYGQRFTKEFNFHLRGLEQRFEMMKRVGARLELKTATTAATKSTTR
jgi:nucleoside-diphosphate-sugar epimerase